jgi:hypothetical protein
VKVQAAENGWPGIFLPGDEALGLAHDMRRIADGLEKETLGVGLVAAFLRRNAAALEACKGEQAVRRGLVCAPESGTEGE